MFSLRLIFVTFIALVLHCDFAQAQIVQKKDKAKILLNADFIERDNEKDITILRDNVQIIFEQNFISCTEAVILWSKNEIVAVGDVLLRTAKADIQADKIIFNFKDEKGKIFNGIILSGKVLMQAEFIEKTGINTYKAEDAYFTACTVCPASWSFTVDKMEATIEGYAYLSSPWLNILEFPTIYTPYLILPLKNERQTGLLTPTFDATSRGGFGIEFPYFWAIDRSQDMTFALKNYDKRGLQGILNYRYRLSPTSSGELNTAFLKDRAFNNESRWFTSYSHYLELPKDFVQRTTIHLASDLQYPTDFQPQFPFLGEAALDNRTSLTKNNPDYHLSVDSSYYLSLIQTDIGESRETSVHRIPEIRFALTDKKVLDDVPLFFRFDSAYANYVRQGLGFDSPFNLTTPLTGIGYLPGSATGVFDPATDKIRTGQRLDLQPHFYAPFRLFNKALDVTPFATYRHTQYLLGALNESQGFDFFPHRNYAMFGVNTSTEVSAIYQGSESKYRHSVIPSVEFQTIPWFYQTNHPFFGTQDQIPYFLQTQPLQEFDLQPGGRGLQFDYEDRIIGRRLMNLGISNRVTRKRNANYGSQYDQTFLFALTQAYDFIEANKTDGLPWQDLRGLMNIRWGKVDSFTEIFHFPYHKVTNVSSRLRLNIVETNYFEVIYSNYLNVPARPLDVNENNRFETVWLSTGLTSRYAAISGQVEYSFRNSQFQRWMINSELIPPGECWTISTNVFKTLDIENNYGISAMINFKFGN